MDNQTTLSAPEREYVTAETGAKQVLCPANVPGYDLKWFSEREAWLLSKGWEKEPAASGLGTYRDPKGSRLRGELRDVKELPVKGDDLRKTETLRQFHVPPLSYSFTLEEALDIQHRRDAFGNDGPSLQDRLGSCEQRCNKLEDELEQFKARVKALLTTHQLSYEGLRLGLRELIGV